MSVGDKDPLLQLNAYRYTGKRTDTGSGTIDMGARRFSPDATRFLQPDVYGGALANLGLSSDSLTGNRYGLAGGNPVSFVEVDGHRLAAIGPGNATRRPGPNGPPAGDPHLPDVGASADPDRTDAERRQLWEAEVDAMFPDGMVIAGACDFPSPSENAWDAYGECRHYAGAPGDPSSAFVDEFMGSCYAAGCSVDVAERLKGVGQAYSMVGGGFIARGAAAGLGAAGRWLGRFLGIGRTAPRAIVGSVRVTTGLTTKTAARETLATLDVTSAQASAANAAIRRATTSSTIDLIQSGDELVVQIIRPGTNGHQIISTVAGPEGVRRVIQMGFDEAGRLTHLDPKFP